MSEEQVKRSRGRPKKVVEVPVEVVKKAGRPKKLSIAEKEARAEQIANEPPKERKKGGRKKNENFVSFEEAKAIVQAELLHSRSAFDEWYAREKPKTIPRFPYRVYTAEWVSWNDFLGTNNEFSKGPRNWRPMEEAIAVVHALKLKTSNDWLEFCREHPEQVPEDIPRRPDVVYDKWVSWNHWLGNKPVEAIQAKQEAARVAGIYYILHMNDVPGNVLSFGVENSGMSGLKDRYTAQPFTPVALFDYEPERANDIKKVVDALSSPYLGNDFQRITPNVWQIIEALETMLCRVRR